MTVLIHSTPGSLRRVSMGFHRCNWCREGIQGLQKVPMDFLQCTNTSPLSGPLQLELRLLAVVGRLDFGWLGKHRRSARARSFGFWHKVLKQHLYLHVYLSLNKEP